MARPRWQRVAAQMTSNQLTGDQFLYDQALAFVEERFSGIRLADMHDIANGAVDLYIERRRRNTADDNQPAINPTVVDDGWLSPDRVNVTVEFAGPEGATRFRTLSFLTDDTTTLGDIRAMALDEALDRSGEYPGWTIVAYSF